MSTNILGIPKRARRTPRIFGVLLGCAVAQPDKHCFNAPYTNYLSPHHTIFDKRKVSHIAISYYKMSYLIGIMLEITNSCYIRRYTLGKMSDITIYVSLAIVLSLWWEKCLAYSIYGRCFWYNETVNAYININIYIYKLYIIQVQRSYLLIYESFVNTWYETSRKCLYLFPKYIPIYYYLVTR